jgi:hypothetical protein
VDEHASGVETAVHLEQRLRDQGVVFPLFEGNGFLVVGDQRVFVVREPTPNSVEEFVFKTVDREDVELFRVEQGRPSQSRYVDGERVDWSGTLTHVRLWLPSDAVDCVIDADPRTVAGAVVTHVLDETTDVRPDDPADG